MREREARNSRLPTRPAPTRRDLRISAPLGFVWIPGSRVRSAHRPSGSFGSAALGFVWISGSRFAGIAMGPVRMPGRAAGSAWLLAPGVVGRARWRLVWRRTLRVGLASRASGSGKQAADHAAGARCHARRLRHARAHTTARRATRAGAAGSAPPDPASAPAFLRSSAAKLRDTGAARPAADCGGHEQPTPVRGSARSRRLPTRVRPPPPGRTDSTRQQEKIQA